ncbi:Phenylalanine-tRNA ligase [Candidatus Saccharibacteria bacterium RAAC3_TM7_1]|nr:Phenylalanine-tRNA ligase [Candidatus Saccharibacteria bacterium RAAC3_TM7_1]HCZ28865.1 phenylalanine--tRNA ligase subunit alpha [Candidatus Saccharibacteria bacterium]
MNYQDKISAVREKLLGRYETLEAKGDILKAPELRELFGLIPSLEAGDRAAFGQAINALAGELKEKVAAENDKEGALPPLDVTAPFDMNAGLPSLLPSEQGTVHPISAEIQNIADIFYRMGFSYFSSREIDDQYHMFETLNFPKGHPARDDYDTFMTEETDKAGEALVAPAHTSTMQNRILTKLKPKLENGEAIAGVSIDRVFRNEDLDARHEHTFYQCEGVYVAKGVHAGMLVATLKEFLESYYEKELDVQINPYYFPFTEPSFEFSLSCPFCDQKGCQVCSYEGWIELLGCGMIHPNVLKAAGIDPEVYTGFAWGVGVDRLVMMKHGIEDVRHFESAKLDFLRQF